MPFLEDNAAQQFGAAQQQVKSAEPTIELNIAKVKCID